MKSRKIKILEVNSQIVADLCKKAIINKVPKDSEVLRIHYDILTNNFEIVIQSEEFPKLKEGEEIPRLPNPIVSKDIFK